MRTCAIWKSIAAPRIFCADHASPLERLAYTPGSIVELKARVNAARNLLEDSVNVPIHARHHTTFTG